MQDKQGRPLRRVRAAELTSTTLLICGVALLLVAGALQLGAYYAQLRWERGQEALSNQFLPAPTAAEAAESPTEPSPTPTATAQPTVTGSATVMLPPTLTPRPSPTKTPPPAPPANPGTLTIPKLKVSAPIVIVPLVNGQWDMSRILYEAALLAGTGFPGRPGNAAISGHVSLKGRGDGTFRWLEKLQPGDDIIVQQDTMRYIYRVDSSHVVLPTDVSVLAPTAEPSLTLITCTDWDFLKAEYTRRLIVKATLAGQRDTGVPAQ